MDKEDGKVALTPGEYRIMVLLFQHFSLWLMGLNHTVVEGVSLQLDLNRPPFVCQTGHGCP
ncbi:hypothetical protein [Paenibacillus xylanilyticus]|uniref:hypothetical protein n=1 Tax=Paenibacillus xylanilyticus TaxID=248903 RepID=UPI0039A3E2CF